jgi:hypothetical protein
MHFESDELEPFEAATDLLIRRCAAWSSSLGIAVNPFILSAALDFRHDSTDGRLGLWTAASVREFLLEWMPRKVSVTADDAADAPESLRVMLRYLHHTGLDDPTTDPLPVLEDAIAGAASEFRQAMSDERNFGLAKFWMMKALAAGIDPRDGVALQRFTERVQADEVAYDANVLEHIANRQFQGGIRRERALPVLPVALPSEAELADAAEKSRIVQQLRTLVEWVGDGRQLTATGQLKLADARGLVELLDTGDVIDPVIGERTFRTTSSAELGGLALHVEWAKTLRLVRVVKKRLIVVAKSKSLLDDGLTLWLRAFDTVAELDDALFSYGSWRLNLFAEVFDDLLPDVLNALYGLPEPMPVVRLEETVWQACCDLLALDTANEARRESWRLSAGHDLRRVLRLLADLGAVELSTGYADSVYSADLNDADIEHDSDMAPGPYDLPPDAQERLLAALDGETDLVVLTPLGTSAVRKRLLAEGRYAPLVGELSQASAAQLLGMIAERYTPDTGREEIDRWLAARRSDGLELLLDAVRGCAFRTRAAAMLGVLAAAQPDGDRLLQRLRNDLVLAPTAIHLLVAERQLQMEELSAAEGMIGVAEQFLQLLEVGGPDTVREQIADMPDLLEMAYLLENSGHPDVDGLRELRTLVIEPSLHRGRRLHTVGAAPQRPTRKRRKGKGRRKR